VKAPLKALEEDITTISNRLILLLSLQRVTTSWKRPLMLGPIRPKGAELPSVINPKNHLPVFLKEKKFCYEMVY